MDIRHEFIDWRNNKVLLSRMLRLLIKFPTGSLTYRDLFARTNAIVRSEIGEQSPQLELNHPQDGNKFFLNGAMYLYNNLYVNKVEK